MAFSFNCLNQQRVMPHTEFNNSSDQLASDSTLQIVNEYVFADFTPTLSSFFSWLCAYVCWCSSRRQSVVKRTHGEIIDWWIFKNSFVYPCVFVSIASMIIIITSFAGIHLFLIVITRAKQLLFCQKMWIQNLTYLRLKLVFSVCA